MLKKYSVQSRWVIGSHKIKTDAMVFPRHTSLRRWRSPSDQLISTNTGLLQVLPDKSYYDNNGFYKE